jgi:formimidoylglutamate deiminase
MALFAATALLPEGWAGDVRLEWDRDGTLLRVAAGASPEGAERAAGPVVPGMPNLHSHAFQRAMAGLAETARGGDSFWTWRETMYGFVARLDPEMMRAIAALLYVEMLKAGYTSVAEFHYVHHDKDGSPYTDRCVMAEAVLAAADEAGIAATMLPVLYQTGGFGNVAPAAGQRRFVNRTDAFLAMAGELRRRHPGRVVGVAPHSIRAVDPGALKEVVADAPLVHIHIAEQLREVEECLAWSGQRSVDWLLDHVAVDRRWCLVHATHIDESEARRVAATGAVAGLCPTTEANLGDGFFPLTQYDGAWGIGSDSHVSVSPVEELRWLDYGQRLLHRRRDISGGGGALWRKALAGGAQALGLATGALAAGHRADLLVLRADLPTLAARPGERLLDAVVFAGNRNPVRDVFVAGRQVVADGHHPREDRVLAAYRKAIAP